MKIREEHTFRRGDNALAYAPHITSQMIEDFSLRTNRLLIRPIHTSDAPDVFAGYTHTVAHYMTPEPPKKIEDTEAFLTGAIAARKAGTDLQLVITEPLDENFVGLIGLHSRYGKSTPEIGLWITEQHWGKGLGKEAADALIHWANKNMVIDGIIYPVAEDNLRSRKIPEQYGADVGRSFVTSRSWASDLKIIEYKIPKL